MLIQEEARIRLPKELEQVKSGLHYKQETTAPRNWSMLRVPGTINEKRLAQNVGKSRVLCTIKGTARQSEFKIVIRAKQE